MTLEERVKYIEDKLIKKDEEIRKIMITIKPMYDNIHWGGGDFVIKRKEILEAIKGTDDIRRQE